MCTMSSEAEDDLATSLQRSLSTPEPLFGHVDFNTMASNYASNGKVRDLGEDHAIIFKSAMLDREIGSFQFTFGYYFCPSWASRLSSSCSIFRLIFLLVILKLAYSMMKPVKCKHKTRSVAAKNDSNSKTLELEKSFTRTGKN